LITKMFSNDKHNIFKLKSSYDSQTINECTYAYKKEIEISN